MVECIESSRDLDDAAEKVDNETRALKPNS